MKYVYDGKPLKLMPNSDLSSLGSQTKTKWGYLPSVVDHYGTVHFMSRRDIFGVSRWGSHLGRTLLTQME